MAAAATAVLGLWASQASALSLGRLTVLSALGEPLRAEVDIPEINPDEASSLRTTVAQPDAYTAAGMEYNAVMNSLQISLQTRPDGRSYLRIQSSRTISDPFIDLILEANWASGRVVRDYTMLFDPPNLKATPAVAPVAPQISTAAAIVSAPTTTSAAATSTPANTAAPTASATTAGTTLNLKAAPKSKAAAPKAEATAKPATAATTAAQAPAPAEPARAKSEAAPAKEQVATESDTAVSPKKSITTKAGDTASKIANSNKISGVSLDQMLVALLRANPDAFVHGNINRVRSGAVMTLPSAEQAKLVPAAEAREIVIAQSKDFGEYRNRLAANAPASPQASADRQAAGSVQAKVEDKKPAAATPDKLTLSKGAVQGKSAEQDKTDADKIAKERAAKEAQARADELSKNIAELNKLKEATPPAAATAPAAATPSASSATTPTLPTPTAEVAAPEAAPTTPAAVTPTAAKPLPVAQPAPAPVEEPGLLDKLLEEPLVPAAGGVLLALLAGFGFLRMRQRRQAATMDSSFLESRLQPDSFFGASGGQSVDTNDGAHSNSSSMVYSPSQIDAADDVDPVAEADVYLAYGRDMQAEEILKEALRTHPERLAVHQKLLEIYAKRRDLKNFEHIANEAYKITRGEGAEWARICDMGSALDPDNTLYKPGGEPDASDDSAAPSAYVSTNSTVPQTLTPVMEEPVSAPMDLDLDFSLDEEPESNHTAPASLAPTPAPAPTNELPNLDMSFELPAAAAEEPASAPAADNGLDFDLPEPPVAAAPAPQAPAPVASNALEFDMNALSLDLGTPSEQPAGADANDPLATKLALAEEFNAIGDTDGARALIEEIIAEATGDLKARAQAALSKLS